MRRMLLVLAALVVMGGVGCNHHNLVNERCSSCNGHNARSADYVPHLPHQGHQGQQGNGGGGMGGGPAGAYAYPYYTTRGPRDFLNPNPPSIGP